jgi:hypothetical protein
MLDKHTSLKLSTGRPQSLPQCVENLPSLACEDTYLSTKNCGYIGQVVDNCGRFRPGSHTFMRFKRYNLWTNLWIRGVKSVDKPVDRIVENLILWITRELSTSYPQGSASYPQICPQPRRQVFGLGKRDSSSYPHIHSPYYYYYSNKYRV